MINAQTRGVKIRWVSDFDEKGENFFADTKKLMEKLTCFKTDFVNGTTQKFKRSIMHNKFFIFDDKTVWSGSANISDTDLSNFNANCVAVIDSAEIAKLYKIEFEQMYNEKFHELKEKSSGNQNIKIDGQNIVSIYFSPSDKAIENAIIPLIQSAKSYIYIPIFFISHQKLSENLIEAKNRGVDVRVILDATSAFNKYSTHKQLRDAKIPVKVENMAGKMHMKSLIIDDKYSILGSMNLTKSGESYNDENIIIIENPQIAKTFKHNFLYFYENIPDKWLKYTPRPESPDSIGSCFDGVDNNFNGKTDTQDDLCTGRAGF